MDEQNDPASIDSADLKKQKRSVFVWIIILLVVCAGAATVVYFQSLPPPFGTYDAFAKCIASTTTKFYGAWWCPHCHNQKNEFGDAARYLPYVECSNPEASGRLPACTAAGIKNYPTWVFPDGSTTTGEMSLDVLSEKTGCPLPSST